ncbi:MAG: SCO family protein [Anaerolineae bacterium]
MPKALPLLILLLLLLLLLTGCQPYQYHGLLLDSPVPASDVTLTSQTGEPVSLSDFRGQLTALYFGYTFCPDVCPTTLSTLNQALELMGDKADEVQVVMVSVDPDRDTPEALASYLSNFNPDFVGLTSTPEQIASAAIPFGVFFEKHEGSAATGYLVDHTASVMVLDRDGRLRLVIPFETPAEEIAADLKQLLK